MFFVSCVSHAFASVYCCLLVNYWERLTSWLLLVMFVVFFCTFPCGILGQVWYLNVSFSDLCHLSYIKLTKYLTINSECLWKK